MRRLPWLTLVITLVAGLVHASPALTATFELDRVAVGHGEVWRLVTGHLAHFGPDHLLWDTAGLLILGFMSETRDRRRFALTLGGAALAIGAGVWLWQPQFAVYRGLSGIDSALFGLVCARLVADGRRAGHAFSIWLGALAFTGFVFKCGFEAATAATVFAQGGGTLYTPVPLAHLIGAGAGLLCGLTRSARAGLRVGAETRPDRAQPQVAEAA